MDTEKGHVGERLRSERFPSRPPAAHGPRKNLFLAAVSQLAIGEKPTLRSPVSPLPDPVLHTISLGAKSACSPAKLLPRAPDWLFARQIERFKPQFLPNRPLSQTLDTTPTGRRRCLCEMSKKSKRTSAPAPMEIPRPVVQPVGAPGTQPVQPASIPSMFGPGMWCPPRPPQCLPPSSAPYCFGGGIQQPGMAGSSAQQPGMAGSSTQGAWWTPAVAGIGGSRHSWPTADSQEDSDVLVWYVIHS